MKVKVNFTVEIDAEAWTSDYGVEGSKEIRDDVKDFIKNSVTEHLRDLGMLAASA